MMSRYISISVKLKVYLIALLPIVMSCNDIILSEISADTALVMEFNAEYPVLTRATDTGFADGDKIGIYVADYNGDEPSSMSGEDLRANNLPFVYDGKNDRLISSTPIYWKNKNTPVDVVGYYPYAESFDNPSEYTFYINTRQDQTSMGTGIGGYESSDLLWAKCEKAYPDNGSINLAFRHLMAGITVTLEKGEGFENEEWASLQKRILVRNSATSTTVNLEIGIVEPVGDGDASVFALPYEDTFRAVVIPKSYAAGSEILTISIGDQNYDFKKQEIVTFQSGQMHRFSICVAKREAGGDYSFTLTDESVASWIDDAGFHDGIVRQYVVINVETPGTFSEILEKRGIDYRTLCSLKVTGCVNDEDLIFIGDMPMLVNLNMKEVIIYDTKNTPMIYEDHIPNEAFKGTPISNLILPDRLRSIGQSAFEGALIVGTLVFPEGLEEIQGRAFANSGRFKVEFPSTLKKIASQAFLKSLNGELRFPEGLEEIGSSAFEGTTVSGTLVLPESLVSIGQDAFTSCNFTGNLVIPKGIKVIKKRTFVSCKFDGNLILREGLTSIGESAFSGCNFRGELSLPSTVREIGDGCFERNNFSSITLPKRLQLLGKEAFFECKSLRGEIRIPSSIVTIPERCFGRCPSITSVVLNKNIVFIDAEAFTEDVGLMSIICESTIPPSLDPMAFNNVVKAQIKLEVPKEALELYKRDASWREFTRVSEYRNFVCRPARVCALSTPLRQTLILNADGKWRVTHKPDWITLSKTEGSMKAEIVLNVNEMTAGKSLRQDRIVFEHEDGTETTCDLSQYDYEYDEDQLVQLQKHTKGNGINVFFVGDGWDAESIASGEYIELCRNDMEYFFGLPPYDRLRDYFDVYACVALSQDTGVSTMNVSRETKFGTAFSDEKECLISADDIFEYISNLTGLRTGKYLFQGDMWKSLVIFIPNTTEYTGYTYYHRDGSSISICPPSDRAYPNDNRGVIQHEAGGHGFGKLADESVEYNRYVSKPDIQTIEEYHRRDWYVNISTRGDVANVPWASMIFDSNYSLYVDIYEGGFGYTRGIWRSEANSCMSSSIPYYNAISRLDITRRVFRLAGEYFDIERDFYSVDTNEWGDIGIY